MSDIDTRTPRVGDGLPDGSGMVLAALGGLATLALVAAALIAGKPLWLVLTLWLAGGPAITLALALAALPPRAGDARFGAAHEGSPRHV